MLHRSIETKENAVQVSELGEKSGVNKFGKVYDIRCLLRWIVRASFIRATKVVTFPRWGRKEANPLQEA